MNTLQIIAPVLIMLLIGYICKRKEIITVTGVDNIKKYITTFPLPLTIFHAVSTADYSREVLLVFCISLSAAIIAMLVGFAAKNIVKEPYRKYFPYVMTIYEGGMMAFPLYQSLMGAEYMSNIAIIDVPCGIFAFGIYFGMVKMTDQGIKINPKELLKNALSSPCFMALCLGLVAGTTGVMNKFLTTEISTVYISVKDLITAPLSAMILLCVGYEFMLEKDSIGVCLKTVFARLIIHLLLLVGIVFLARKWEFSQPMIYGLILYFLTLPSLCLSSFVKNKEASKYISTTSSLYLIITLIVYMILAGVV